MKLVPHSDLVSTLVLFGVVQGISLAIIFIMKGHKTNHKLMGMVMLTLTLIEIESFLNLSGYIIYFPRLINLSPSLILMLGPLSYLYVNKIVNPKANSKLSLLHVVPAFSYFSYSFFFFLQPESFRINAVLRRFHPESVTETITSSFPVDPLNIQGVVVIEGLALHLMTYSVLCLLTILKNFPASDVKTTRTNFQWGVGWSCGLLLGSVIFLMTGGVINGHVLYAPLLPDYSVNLFCVGIVYVATIFWISKALIAQAVKEKYSKSILSPELQEQKLMKLKEIMNTHRPYKSPDFSLSQLATLANLSTHHTSQVINAGTGMTFNDFVNGYRVQEARSVLQSPLNNNVKVENLAYELGYKSKSAFFTSFRRYTNTTPARFREMAQRPERSALRNAFSSNAGDTLP